MQYFNIRDNTVQEKIEDIEYDRLLGKNKAN